jgi:hypothetical protein
MTEIELISNLQIKNICYYQVRDELPFHFKSRNSYLQFGDTQEIKSNISTNLLNAIISIEEENLASNNYYLNKGLAIFEMTDLVIKEFSFEDNKLDYDFLKISNEKFLKPFKIIEEFFSFFKNVNIYNAIPQNGDVVIIGDQMVMYGIKTFYNEDLGNNGNLENVEKDNSFFFNNQVTHYLRRSDLIKAVNGIDNDEQFLAGSYINVLYYKAGEINLESNAKIKKNNAIIKSVIIRLIDNRQRRIEYYDTNFSTYTGRDYCDDCSEVFNQEGTDGEDYGDDVINWNID